MDKVVENIGGGIGLPVSSDELAALIEHRNSQIPSELPSNSPTFWQGVDKAIKVSAFNLIISLFL